MLILNTPLHKKASLSKGWWMLCVPTGDDICKLFCAGTENLPRLSTHRRSSRAGHRLTAARTRAAVFRRSIPAAPCAGTALPAQIPVEEGSLEERRWETERFRRRGVGDLCGYGESNSDLLLGKQSFYH